MSIKISELPVGTALSGTEEIPIVQSATTKKITAQDVADLASPDLSGLVPYTGAITDVDLGNNDLNAKGIKIKGTAGNGHLNLKHQSSGATASGSESVIYADSSGNPKWKNDGNAVQSILLSGTTTADIADSLDKRYVTDAQQTVITNTSGTNTGDQTFFNARVQTVSSSATVTAISTNDIVTITAQAVGLTLANPTGTFAEGQSLIIRIKDNGTARSIAYGTNFRAIGVTAPTTTVISKTTYLGCIYNDTDTKFDIIGVCTEA